MRKFLEKVDVLHVRKPVSFKQELTDEIVANKELPILFENVTNSKMKILAGTVSSRELLAQALGVTKEELSDRVGEAYAEPIPLQKVDDAPFLKNHVKNPDLAEYLPIPEFHGGKRYLTASIVLSKDPKTGRRNASIHRMMYIEKNRFAIRPVPQRDLHNFYVSTLDMGKEWMDIVIIIGVHPVFELGAATSFPNLDEFMFAARLLGGAEEIDIDGFGVPVGAEIVMKAKMLKEEVQEGPFIDLTGTEDKMRMQPVVEVTDLYFRDDPIFRTILPGRKEHKLLMGIPQEPRMKSLISNTIPTVKQVVMTEGGGSWLHAVVQIKKRTHGDGKNTILAALAAHPSLKRVVVVDEDVDPSDPVDVEWAIATRVQPDKDLLLVPGAKGSSLDPSAGEMSTTCKWGIDATKPLGSTKFERIV